MKTDGQRVEESWIFAGGEIAEQENEFGDGATGEVLVGREEEGLVGAAFGAIG